jgi:hypothetical protein
VTKSEKTHPLTPFLKNSPPDPLSLKEREGESPERIIYWLVLKKVYRSVGI